MTSAEESALLEPPPPHLFDAEAAFEGTIANGAGQHRGVLQQVCGAASRYQIRARTEGSRGPGAG